jgi:hypothetical protein
MSLSLGGFSFGGSASRTRENSTTNSSSTTTPIVPEWASSLVQGSAGRVGDLWNQDPQRTVAPAHWLTDKAVSGANFLSGSPWNFDAAADLTRGAANTSWMTPYMSMPTPSASESRAYDYVDRYFNPYLRDVVDSTGADFDANAGRVRAQQALDLAGAGAFGGSGVALTQSMTEGELARARASALGGLRSQGYQTALGAAGGDADRATQTRIANAQMALQDWAQKTALGLQGQQQQLKAADQLAGVSGAYDANQRANIATQAQLGDTGRTIEQQQRQAPFTTAQQIVAMLQGLPINLFVGEQKVGTENTKKTSTTGSLNFGWSG